MGDIFDQLATQKSGQADPPPVAANAAPSAAAPQATQPQPQGDIFDQLASGSYKEPTGPPAPPPPADFLQRAYETSPIKGIVDMAKQKWDAEKQKGDEDAATAKQVVDFVKSKDWGRAAELLLSHVAKRSGQAIIDLPPVAAVSGAAQSSYQHGKAAVNAASQGNAGEAIAQGAEAVPVLGQVAEQIGEPLGKDIKEGNYAGAAGDIVGGASSIAPMLLGGESKAAESGEPGILRSGETEVAGQKIPVRASTQPGVKGKIAGSAELGADTGSLKKFDVEKTQPAARRAVSNVASEAAQGEPVAMYNKARSEYVLPKDDAFGFGREGDSVKARSQRTFQQLDKLSEGKFSQAQDDAAAARQDYTPAGRKAYREALADQEKIFTKHADQFSPDELNQARADWKQSQGLEDLRTRFNRSVHPTPVELTKPGEPDIGYVNGKTFREAITDGLQKDTRGQSEFERAGFTPEHVQTIEDIGRLLEKGNNYHKLNPLVKLLGSGLQAIPHPGGLAAAPLEFAASKILGRVMTNPAGSGVLLKGLKSGASVAAIANALRPYASPSEQSSPTTSTSKQ